MIQSERNHKQFSILFRKYKPVSHSLLINKAQVQTNLPPLQIQASLKYQLKKITPRIPQPKYIENIAEPILTGKSHSQTEIIAGQYALNSKPVYTPYSKKQLFQFPSKSAKNKGISCKFKTEQIKPELMFKNEEKLNKWSQTTFDEDQLLEYLNS